MYNSDIYVLLPKPDPFMHILVVTLSLGVPGQGGEDAGTWVRDVQKFVSPLARLLAKTWLGPAISMYNRVSPLCWVNHWLYQGLKPGLQMFSRHCRDIAVLKCQSSPSRLIKGTWISFLKLKWKKKKGWKLNLVPFCS